VKNFPSEEFSKVMKTKNGKLKSTRGVYVRRIICLFIKHLKCLRWFKEEKIFSIKTEINETSISLLQATNTALLNPHEDQQFIRGARMLAGTSRVFCNAS
jgi:hypothetical protein